MAFGGLLRLGEKYSWQHGTKTQIRARKMISMPFLNADQPEFIHHCAM